MVDALARGDRDGREPAHRRTLLVGCGKLGGALARHLVASGREVFAIRRDIAKVPHDVVPIGADLTRPLAEPLPFVTEMVIALPPSFDSEGYGPALRHVHEALPGLPARTLFVSSTGVFEGWDGPQPITEEHVPHPASPRATVLREGELAAIDLFDAAVVRPAGIYGPGREFLVRTVRERRPIKAATWTNRIHESDLVRVLDALLSVPTPPRYLHAVDGHPARLGEVVRHVADLLASEPPPESDGEGRVGNIFDGSLMRRYAGEPEFPSYREGYRQMIADA